MNPYIPLFQLIVYMQIFISILLLLLIVVLSLLLLPFSHTCGIWKFWGQGLNWRCNCWPISQPMTTLEPSCINDLYSSLWQHQVLNPLRKARYGTHFLIDTSQVLKLWATTGTPPKPFFDIISLNISNNLNMLSICTRVPWTIALGCSLVATWELLKNPDN